jgi:putative DNA primase/helicase
MREHTQAEIEAEARVYQFAEERRRRVDDDDITAAIKHSDDDLALKLAAKHKDELRHVSDWGQWYVWDGRVWSRDDKRRVFTMTRDLCRHEAAMLKEKEQVKSLNSNHTTAAVVSLARCDQRLVAGVTQWDTHDMLLNTPAGIIDLESGEMLRNVIRLQYYMTKITTVSPSDRGCPRFLKFLDEISGGDQTLVDYLQRMFGYCLTGSTREHALFFFYGTGANGKSVLINIISYILGEYQRTAPMETFTASQSDRHPTELAGLMGRRLVTATETEEGRRWAESKVKQLTGGDEISARFMRQDFFEFTPQFKLVIAGNHKPGLRSVGEATKRRFNLVPFTVTIPEDDRDPELLDKLTAEAPGILQWMIDGCVAWQETGLKAPAVVTEATKAYLLSEDSLAGWIEDCCELGPTKFEPISLLYASWRKWAQESGEKYLDNKKAFGQALDDRGLETDKGAQGVRIRRGIALTDEASVALQSQRWQD